MKLNGPKRRNGHRFAAALAGAAACCAGAGAQAQYRAKVPVRQVFQLGQFDGSSAEFSQDVPAKPVSLLVDAHTSPREWTAFQPEVATGAVDPLAKRTIRFALPAQPARVYTVAVSLLIEHASVPALQVSVNGHEGTFFLDPKLDRRVGDGGAVSFPSFSTARVSFEVPAAFLHQGENEIAFTAVPTHEGPHVPDAGFNYDAIEMHEGPEQPSASADQGASLVPTIFYKKLNQQLAEGVDITLREDREPIDTATLLYKGKRYDVPLDRHAAWGEVQSRVYLPDLTDQSELELVLQRGRTRQVIKRTVRPQKRWTVYVVPHVHLDLGYTDFQAKVASVQGRVVDEALDLMDLHPEFRFSMDGMWSFEQFLATRTPADATRALTAMQARKFFVPPQYSNELTGFASGETLLRSLYPGAQWNLKHGIPVDYANITDVPSYSWSYASILAAAGIHELVAGANNGRAPVLLRGHLDENSPFQWEGPDGQKVLMWYSLHYHQMWTLFGLPPVTTAGEETLPLFLQAYERPSYKGSSILLYGTQVENTDLYPGQATVVSQWNQEFAYPHLQYAGFHEALQSVAAEFHGALPTVRGDGGPYWEDGIAADATNAATERETEARAPTAEKVATLTTLANGRLAADKSRLDAMWQNMVLMDEHTWTAGESFTDSENDEATVQLRVKDAHATQAAALRDDLLRQGMADLADSIDVPAGGLVVFNGLNWSRNGEVALDIRNGFSIADSRTGAIVPVQVLSRGEHTSRVRFLAQDVPALGYRTYRLVDRQLPAQTEPAPQGNTLESPFYRVVLDPETGSIRSLFDKQTGRELADASSAYRMGEYLYVTTKPGQKPGERFAVHGATQGRVVKIEETPDEIIAHLESQDVNTPRISTEVTLSKHEKKLALTVDVDKTSTKEDEAVYIAFPFAMEHPRFRYAIQNGVVDPSHDMYPGAGLDWFSVQHWASVDQDGVTATVMPLDASLMTFGDISRLSFPETFGSRRGAIFSYIMNNYWHTNYRAEQGGPARFRYVITSGENSKEPALSHQAWEEFTPLEVSEVTRSDKAVDAKRPLNGTSGSFLQVNDPDVVLEAWKPAEDGHGTILRFVDLGAPARTLHLAFPQNGVEKAWLTDALERDQQPLPVHSSNAVELPIRPHAIVTIRVESRIPVPSACGRFCEP